MFVAIIKHRELSSINNYITQKYLLSNSILLKKRKSSLKNRYQRLFFTLFSILHYSICFNSLKIREILSQLFKQKKGASITNTPFTQRTKLLFKKKLVYCDFFYHFF